MSTKRAKLVYSYSRNNKNFYGGYILSHPQKGSVFVPVHKSAIYTPSIAPIVKALFRHELEEAKRRVSLSGRGGYRYTPSANYIKAYSRICIKSKSKENEIQKLSWPKI